MNDCRADIYKHESRLSSESKCFDIVIYVLIINDTSTLVFETYAKHMHHRSSVLETLL